jgi:hypothetical protein
LRIKEAAINNCQDCQTHWDLDHTVWKRMAVIETFDTFILMKGGEGGGRERGKRRGGGGGRGEGLTATKG